MLKLLVAFGESKKKIEYTKVQLMNRVESTFRLESGSYFVQLWDSEFSDWMDLDDLDTLDGLDVAKLQVVRRLV
jgi:hypothetical protein